MTLKIEPATAAPTASTGALSGHDAAQVFSLLEQLRGRELDAGTAELVAQLTTELRGPRAPARTAVIELRSGDEFHEGFAHVVEDLSAQLKRDRQATLAISYERVNGGSTMTLALSGAQAAVEAAEREISAAARGAVDLRWDR